MSEPKSAYKVSATAPTAALKGLVFDVASEDYHAHASISKSGLDLIDLSPAHFKLSVRKETAAFKAGTLIHCAILEPDCLNARYFAMPEKPDLRTKAGKALAEDYSALAGDRVLLTTEEMALAVSVRDAVQSHSIAKQLFTGGIAEASVFSTLNGVDVRCRPDYINGSVVIDLKSTECATLSAFRRSLEKYRYYVQHPFYLDVMRQENIDAGRFVFVAIEKTAPYGIGVFMLDEVDVDLGRKAYQANLDTYKRCLDSGHWPGYPAQVKTLSLSQYARDSIERRIDNSY
jgi:hypothetical protein